MPHLHLEFTIPDTLKNQRLDHGLATLCSDYSRSRWQSWIRQGKVTVNGKLAISKQKLQGDESIILDTILIEESTHEPQNIALDIIYEDDALLIINKAAGMVVHPAVGNRNNTLLNALLHHAPELANVPRAGIVHRLDKGTSGLLMIARTLSSHTYLVRALQARKIHREYKAIAQGRFTAGGSIEAPIGRNPLERLKMAVIETGKPALTHYRIAERFSQHTLLNVKLETGRTHQIRVHLAHIKHPLVGDPVYGGRFQLPRGANAELVDALRQFKRQALHAYKLALIHPVTGEQCEWTAPMPADLEGLLQVMRNSDRELAA